MNTETYWDGVLVRLGTGTGDFSGATFYCTGDSPQPVMIWDQNGDGKLDIATATRGDQALCFLTGLGNGYFQVQPDSVGTVSSSGQLEWGDVNQDGRPDVIMADGAYANALLQMPDGTFTGPVVLSTQVTAHALPLDVDQDGHVEILVSDYKGLAILEQAADDPRDNRAVVRGRLDTSSDSDWFSFTAQAGSTWMMDIDAAEFQSPLDASLALFDAAGNRLALSTDDLDRESGIGSVDPYLTYQFAAEDTYFVQVASQRSTAGDYRFKLTPSTAIVDDAPQILAVQVGGRYQPTTSTRQIMLWTDGQLDPASLTSSNIVVTGDATGVQAGHAAFDPISSVLTSTADAALPNDSYTIDLRGAGGVVNLRGVPLDGETSGTLDFPTISGNGSPGGDFRHRFIINQQALTPAGVISSFFAGEEYNRSRFTFHFDSAPARRKRAGSGFHPPRRGAGRRLRYPRRPPLPLDSLQDKLTPNTLDVYSRGALAGGTYRVEGSFLDAAGHAVSLSEIFAVTTSVRRFVAPSVIDVNVQPESAIRPGRCELGASHVQRRAGSGQLDNR